MMSKKLSVINISKSREHFLIEESLSVRKLKKAELLLPYRLYTNAYNKNIIKHRTGKIKVSRLYDDTKTISNNIIDIDKDYYMCSSRLINVYRPIFKSLELITNKRLRKNHEKGIKNDCVLNIDTNFTNERAYYKECVTLLVDQAKYFDTFISEDYKKSIAILTQSEILRTKVDLMSEELQNIAIKKFYIKSKLIGLDYKYCVQQKYGRFLYYISPPHWRGENREFARSVEIEAKGFDLGKLNEDDTFAVIYEKLRTICYSARVEPILYFTEPSGLMEVFNSMEEQQLYYFTHVNHLAPHTKSLKDNIRLLTYNISQDFLQAERLIKSFNDLLEFTEKRCAQLEKRFMQLLHGQFYRNTAATEVLKLYVNLNICYQRVFLNKPINMDILVLAKALENCFFKYSKLIDSIKGDSIRRAMISYAEAEREKFKMAQRASTELRMFRRLEHRLLRAHGFSLPTIDDVVYSIKNKKIVRTPTFNMNENIRECLDESVIEYLTFFTEWTENEDPNIYLKNSDKNFREFIKE